MDSNQCKAKGGQWQDNRCVLPSHKTKSSKFSMKKLVLVILIIAALGFVNILITNLSTITHEIGGHVLVAKLLGCKAEGSSDIYVGTTTFFDCPMGQKTEKICDSAAQCNDNDTSTNDTCDEGKCHYEKKIFNIIIAFASLFLVFFVALGLWIFFNKDSVVRVLSIVMFVYSCIPSAFPLMPGSDMAYAITQGFPLWLGWAIYLTISGVFLWLITDEVTETEYFNKYLE